MSKNQELSNLSNQPLFSIRDLTKTYVVGEVEIHALRGVDVDIQLGESIVLLGPSGSGKSTLLNILGGLDRMTSGEVLFQGKLLSDFSESALTEYRRLYVGFVFQFYNLIPSLTALENVTLITDISKNGIEAKDALKIVGLENRLHHFPAQLSGGEQQRVAIARALAKQPEVLLCDEPTGALDFETGILVLEALNNVNRDLGTTMILITHNAGIANMADRVLHLTDGKIAKIDKNTTKCSPKELSW